MWNEDLAEVVALGVEAMMREQREEGIGEK